MTARSMERLATAVRTAFSACSIAHAILRAIFAVPKIPHWTGPRAGGGGGGGGSEVNQPAVAKGSNMSVVKSARRAMSALAMHTAAPRNPPRAAAGKQPVQPRRRADLAPGCSHALDPDIPIPIDPKKFRKLHDGMSPHVYWNSLPFRRVPSQCRCIGSLGCPKILQSSRFGS